MKGHETPGRYCILEGEREATVDDLYAGLDYRQPRYRRACFLRFYQFHLRYKAHPGCVYYLIPYLGKDQGWDTEDYLRFAYINGNTQNPVTSWLLFERSRKMDGQSLFRDYYARYEFDTDRRYHKKAFITNLMDYEGRTKCGQAAYFKEKLTGGDFASAWRMANEFPTFGRLSAFSYLEYLRICGLPIECDTLFLDDIPGSRSHRNGLCKVLGRDDLDWHESNPTFDGRYSPEIIEWLKHEGRILLEDARALYEQEEPELLADATYFTLESALCTYKSWYRPNRRYPNVYNDMLHDRIKRAQKNWPEADLGIFWKAREDCLPPSLRLECNQADRGVHPDKQNHFRLTGSPVMMDRDWGCFQNDYNDHVNAGTTH